MNNKIEKFIRRNRIRNSKLYQQGLVEGQDYIVCPVSKERLLNIRSSYIINVLGMTVEEYDKNFPNILKSCAAHKNNIKKGLHNIDSLTGLSKYELGQQKARDILKKVDANGISGYKKKGQKTRATHLSKIDELGRNGYSQIASKAIIKGNKTKAEKGLITSSNNRNEFYRYKLIVLHLTEKYRKEITKGYITGLAGKQGVWHIDHKFSIFKGYQNKISPFLIGHKENLQMVPWKQNISKNSKCSITVNDLFKITNSTEIQSYSDFQKIICLIQEDITNNIQPNAAFLLERFYETSISK